MKSNSGQVSVLPKQVKLGNNFVVNCRIKNPKRGLKEYIFSLRPLVPKGKKYRMYSSVAFPGVAHLVFKEVA